ncbi:hypothetical protein APR40_02560 [Salegentibacter salarius]|uniref:Uncharacterized protein n=1 Tax=Salegentibacter salarius TaxID=435906 RepID=A0A2N0TUS8_9FLAO|nr:hypothetical protein BHS39_02560 [Salegentibacter salarius]PKD18466.1 hypothetical protein APR40_02560 [Salegentibacter salarius]
MISKLYCLKLQLKARKKGRFHYLFGRLNGLFAAIPRRLLAPAGFTLLSPAQDQKIIQMLIFG